MAHLNKILLLCCTLLLVAVNALAQQAPPPSDWRRYTVRDEEFSIILPTVPAMTTYKQSRSPYQAERTWRQLGVYAMVWSMQFSLTTRTRRARSRMPISE